MTSTPAKTPTAHNDAVKLAAAPNGGKKTVKYDENSSAPIVRPPSHVFGPYAANGEGVRWRVMIYSDNAVSPEERRAARLLNPPPVASAPVKPSPVASTSALTANKLDVLTLIPTEENRIPPLPDTTATWEGAEAFKAAMREYDQKWSDAMPTWAFRFATATSCTIPGRGYVDFACHFHKVGCTFLTRAKEQPGGRWAIVNANWTHDHTNLGAKPKTTQRSKTKDLASRSGKPKKKKPRLDLVAIEEVESGGASDNEDEVEARETAQYGPLVDAQIVHPVDGTISVVKLRSFDTLPVVYGAELPPTALPLVNCVYTTKEAFRASAERYAAAQLAPMALRRTSESTRVGHERVVLSCSHYSSKHASCGFMLRCRKMPENGLWIVTAAHAEHSKHLAGRQPGAQIHQTPPRRQAMHQQSASRSRRRRATSSSHSGSSSSAEEVVAVTGSASRPARPPRQPIEEERELSPGLVGNFLYRSARTPLSDDEPEPVYVAGRAVPPGAVVTMTNTASSSEVEEAIKSAKKGVARVLPKKRVIVEDEDENASGEEEGVYVRDAEQGRFDARLAWPTNKKLQPVNAFLQAYIDRVALPKPIKHEAMDIDAPAGQPLEAFLRSLHPALVACAPALAAQGVSTSSALLSLPRARILTLNDLSAVEKTLLLRRLPA